MLCSVVNLFETFKSSLGSSLKSSLRSFLKSFLKGSRLGEEVTRIALLLALMSLFCGGMTGCTRPSPPLMVQKRIRIGTMLPLHPLWAQVVALDRTIASLRVPRRSSGALGSPLSPLPPTLAVAPAVPATVVEARRRRAKDFETDYLRQLAETLRMKDEAYLARLAKRTDKDAEAAYRRELAERMTAIRAGRIRQAEVLDREISRLRFRDVPLQLQLNVDKGQGAQDALIQHDLLLAQIDQLSHEAEALVSPTIIADLAKSALKGRLQGLLEAGKEQVSQESERLARERANHIEREEGKLRYGVEPVTSISRIALPNPGPEQAPLALSPVQIEGAALQTASGHVGASVAAQARIWQEERERLVEVIRADTEQAVQEIATRQGWTIVTDTGHKASGIPDVTERVKSLLRSRWRQP